LPNVATLVKRSGDRLQFAGLALALLLAGCGGGGRAGGGTSPSTTPFQQPAAGDRGADRLPLSQVMAGQYLVPVQIGDQILNLLVDTGFMGVLVFGDALDADNPGVRRTSRTASLQFGSGRRTGVFADAALAVGSRIASPVRIVVIDQPTSQTDPSLTPKGAQGILGLRFKPGTGGAGGREVDPILLQLRPAVRAVEFDLGPPGDAWLTLGGTPVLNAAAPRYVFTAQTTTALGGDRVNESYADLEVPFRIASAAGSDSRDGLRVLLDTGAVAGLVLGAGVAARLGYDVAAARWNLPADATLDLTLIGTPGELAVQPPLRLQEVLVTNLAGSSFDAVLGVSRWQPYLVAFDFVDFTLGGPFGSFRFLRRSDAPLAQQADWLTTGFVRLDGLNSSYEDASPVLNQDGTLLVFDSDRPTGAGRRDVFAYRLGQGLLDLPGLNTSRFEEAPAVSADGSLIAFTSDRDGGEGDWDIYLYDVAAQALVPLPGLNTAALERTPGISPDGRYVSFRTERRGGSDSTSEILVYDRQTASLVDLPGLNRGGDAFTSRLSAGLTRIAYDALDRPGDLGVDDVHLYEVAQQRDLPLSAAVNTPADDLFVSLSGDGSLLAFQTDRQRPNGGGAAMDVVLFDLALNGPDGLPGVAIPLPGLNLPDYEDSSPSLSLDGRYLAFTSNRPRGVGGPDIYLYDRGAVR